ncbi:DUF6126 family protein [Streptomyces sp. NPDC058613]|uniref:DUF6126 family protein n=1 Tax=Streptomyces sp. NPDC058613 TaxID=3346556 RepID=UPI003656E8CF
MSQGENMPYVSETAKPAAKPAGTPAGTPGTPWAAVEVEAVEAAEASAPTGVRSRIESKFPRGLVIRLIAYLFVGHLFAFFVYLLFVLGAENQ